MSQAEVRRLIGEPARDQSTPVQIIWRYPCGTAYFDIDSRRLVGAER
jgi:hypothetical protein